MQLNNFTLIHASEWKSYVHMKMCTHMLTAEWLIVAKGINNPNGYQTVNDQPEWGICIQ